MKNKKIILAVIAAVLLVAVLIGAWAQVFGLIQENRKLPFE